MTQPMRIEGDWYDGVVPGNVRLDKDAYIETSFCFSQMHSRQTEAMRFGKGSSVYSQSVFDLGEEAVAEIGDYTMINNAYLMCDQRITLGSHTLVSWNVVILDNLRYPLNVKGRAELLQNSGANLFSLHRGDQSLAKPVSIGSNVWIGFDCCIMPGVTIHDGAVIGARSVVTEDVPAFTVAAGNPARLLRELDRPEAGRSLF